MIITPTFECAGITNAPTSNFQFREVGGIWHEGHPLYKDGTDYRGSIFWLKPNTEYEVKCGSETQTFKTRNDNPPSTTRKTLTSGQTITESGTPDNFVTYSASSTLTKGVIIKASYIIIYGIEIVSANTGILVSGENMATPPHDVFINGCVIDSTSTANNDSCIRIDYGANKITVQDCHLITNCPTNLEDKNGIYHWKAGGELVFRHNYIDGTPWDGIGGGQEDVNTTLNNCDIYENEIKEAWDDAIQCEGGGVNTRVWGNKTKSSMLGVTTAPCLKGPAYLLFNEVCADKMKRGEGNNGLFAHGDDSTGRVYIYNNSYWGMPGSNGVYAKNYGVFNQVSRNNIISAGWYVIEFGHDPDGTDCDYDYDLLYTTDAGRFVKWGPNAVPDWSAQELHSVKDNPIFVDGPHGDFTLQSNSPAIGKGVIIPNINDDTAPLKYQGNNIGAWQIQEDEDMKTMSGQVSSQAVTGESVTITITPPSGSNVVLTATTNASKGYSTTYDAINAGTYSVVSSIPEDTEYSAATSPVVTFTVGKTPRTITLSVS